jgi:hypothetical protein
VSEWQELAEPSFQEPQYVATATLEQHLAANAGKAVQRQQAGKEPRWWQRRKLARAETDYPAAVQKTEKQNAKTHDSWRTAQAATITELCGYAILSGDDEAAARYADVARDRGQDPATSDKIGMALVARGQHEQAKNVLLGRRSDNQRLVHAHNLLDAYAWTGDPDYREHLVRSLRHATYLVGRLARVDIAAGRPSSDLFDAADGPSGARLLLALSTVHLEGVSDPDRLQQYIDTKMPGLHPPKRRYLPLPAQPTTGQRVGNHIKDTLKSEGISGVLDLASDALEVAVDGVPQRDQPTPQESPEFKKFLSSGAPLIANLRPWLQNRADWTDSGFGDVTKYKPKGAQEILLTRADGGDDDSAHRLLAWREAGDNIKFYAYRNLAHTNPSTAAESLHSLNRDSRRLATFYTIVALAARGQVVHQPDTPQLTDEFGGLQQLYAGIRESAEEKRSIDETPQREVVLAEAQLTDVGQLHDAGLDAILARIHGLNDPAAERAALQELAARLRRNQ